MDNVKEILDGEIISLLDCCKTERICEYSDVERQTAYVNLFFERAYVEFQKCCKDCLKECDPTYVKEIVKKYMKSFRAEIGNQMDREAEKIVFDIHIDYAPLLKHYPELMKCNEIKKAIELNSHRCVKLCSKPIKSEYLSKYECHSFVQDYSDYYLKMNPIKLPKIHRPIPSRLGEKTYEFENSEFDQCEDYKSNVSFIAGYYYLSLEHDLDTLEQGLNAMLTESGEQINQKICKCKIYFENALFIRSILQEYFKDSVSVGEVEAEAQIKDCLTEVAETIKKRLKSYD